MKSLILEKTDHTPRVEFNLETAVFEIKGESRPENVSKFYDPVLVWLNDFYTYTNDLKVSGKPFSKKIEVLFSLEYFNSSSIKFVYDILKKFEELNSNVAEIVIKWVYDKADEDMHENGVEFSKIINLDFQLIAK